MGALRQVTYRKTWRKRAHLFGVHVVDTYAALKPPSLFSLPHKAWSRLFKSVADYQYDQQTQKLLPRDANSQSARFMFRGPVRSVEVLSESLNTIALRIGPGPASKLFRTDTYYPGWRATSSDSKVVVRPFSPCFSISDLPESEGSIDVRFFYRPRFLLVSASLSLMLVLLVFAILLYDIVRRVVKAAAGGARGHISIEP